MQSNCVPSTVPLLPQRRGVARVRTALLVADLRLPFRPEVREGSDWMPQGIRLLFLGVVIGEN